MKKLLSILPIILIVLAAGCTSNKHASSAVNNGIQLVDFYTSPSEAGPGDPVTVYYQIKNTGDKDAKNVVAVLFGAKEVLGQDRLEDNIGDLSPIDKRYGGTGEPYLGTFLVSSPKEIPYNQKVEVPLHIRIYYDYSSSAVTDAVNIYSKDEWKRMSGKGQTIGPEKVNVINNDGPIQFYVDNPVNPIIDPSREELRVPIIIHMRNVGEGVPFMNNEDGLISGSVKVIGSAIQSMQCISGGDTFYPSKDDSSYVNLDFKLTRKGEKEFVCYVYFDKSAIQPINSLQFAFDFNYRYYITGQTSFTAWGQE